MPTGELVARSPVRAFDQRAGGGLEPGQMGLVAARAGTGKTAFLIQVALDALLRGESVLHVGIGETVGHVRAWYSELLRAQASGMERDRLRALEEDTERRRLILTFRTQAFGTERLEERLGDLVEQGIFVPGAAVVDGLELVPDAHPVLESFGRFAAARSLPLWVACRVHREAGPVAGLVAPVLGLFRVVVGLESEGERVLLTVYRNPAGVEGPSPVTLDPRTLLLTLPNDG